MELPEKDIVRYSGLILVAITAIAGSVFLAQTEYFGSSKAVNCINQTSTCDRTVVEKRPSNCDPWAPWYPRSKLDCNYTEEGVSQVSLIADPGNYITASMTDEEYTVETLQNRGNTTWELRFLPSGDRIWTDRSSGRLMRTVDGNTYTIRDFDIYSGYLSGVMGIALDPSFRENRRIYLFKTDRKTENNASKGPERTIVNQVLSFRLDNTTLTDRKLLFEAAGGENNAGGRMEFGPDGKLYISSMEPAMYSDFDPARFPGSYILRVNKDGSIPEDNPFKGSRIYSMGHRNAQGLGFNPETGELYSSEHGPHRHDEINLIEAGKSYGWPGYRCGERLDSESHHGASPDNYDFERPNTPPEVCFDEWTMAPSGITFVDDPGHPWHGDLFVAGLRGKHLHRFIFEDGEIVDREVFYSSYNEEEIGLRLRDVEYFNGSLYVAADNGGGIAKLTPR